MSVAVSLTVLVMGFVVWRAGSFANRHGLTRTSLLSTRPTRDQTGLLERFGSALSLVLPSPWRRLVSPRRLAAMTLTVALVGLVSPGRAVLLAVLCAGVIFAGDRKRRAEQRRAQRAEFPELVDLLGVALQSGRTLLHAIEFVCADQPGELHRRLLSAATSVQHGTRFVDALQVIGSDGDTPELSTLVTTLVSAERYGVALPLALHELARDVRELRRRQGEAEARRVPIRMLGPLVVFLLPSFALLTVAPLLASGLSSLSLGP